MSGFSREADHRGSVSLVSQSKLRSIAEYIAVPSDLLCFGQSPHRPPVLFVPYNIQYAEVLHDNRGSAVRGRSRQYTYLEQRGSEKHHPVEFSLPT